MTQATINGQVLGQAESATRAVLERLLDREGTSFHQWVGLNLVAAAGGSIGQADFVGRMSDGLKIDEWTVTGAIATLAAAGWVDEDPDIRLTDAGRAVHTRLRLAINAITAKLYADLSPDDLATAGRILTIVTERANAELAA